MSRGLTIMIVCECVAGGAALSQALTATAVVDRVVRPHEPNVLAQRPDVVVWRASDGVAPLERGLAAAGLSETPPPIAPMSDAVDLGDIAALLEPFAFGREMRPIADRRRLELRDLSKALAHELKAPLASVRRLLGFVERRLLEGSTDDAMDAVRRADAAAGRADQLIAALVGHATIERRSADEELRLDAVARAAAADAILSHQDRRIEFDIAPLPTVQGDRLLLEELFRHLFKNAVAHDDGPVATVQVSDASSDGAVRVSVRDFGVGVPEAHRERIFEPLVRLSGPQVRPGSGLGLATCAKIAELHDGRIWCEASPEGAGAVFKLEFAAT